MAIRSSTRQLLLLAAIAASAFAVEISLGSFTTKAHQVRGDVFALSARVLEVRNFNFDGNAPAGYFWADTNSQPSGNGYRLQDAAPSNGCGKLELNRASSETYTVEFPQGTSLLDIRGGSFSVWCEAFSSSFGELIVPDDLEGLLATANGPALGCSEQPEQPTIDTTPDGYNCEELHQDFQVRWQVQNNNQLSIQLVGRIDENVYMGFGVSGNDTSTRMVGANPVIADVFDGTFRARDFYMNTQAQCSNSDGVCPDLNSAFTNDVSNISGEQDSGVTVVRYTVPLSPVDQETNIFGQPVDRPISIDAGVSTYLVWGLGPIDQGTGLPFFHNIAYPREDVSLEFGRTIQNNCQPFLRDDTSNGTPTAAPEAVVPFLILPLTGVTEFTARIGQSGGERGYQGITGRAGWGISWYINDSLSAVIEMRRGTTYTFKINGGDNPESPSQYHPLYLTTSIDGGYDQRTPLERLEETVFAGIEITQQTDQGGVTDFDILAAGPLCAYDQTDATEQATLTGSFRDYFNSLDTSCASDIALTEAAAILEFTPDESTPDELFYQCVTHRNLGWKIRVIDAEAPSIVKVDCSNLRDPANTISLEDGAITVHAIVNSMDSTLITEVTYDGIGWVAIAVTGGNPIMIGSEAIIGRPDELNSPTNPNKYTLGAYSLAGVTRMPEGQQTLTNATVQQVDGKTILTFIKPLVEENEHSISSTESNTLLYAVGASNDLGYHAARGSFDLTPGQCRILVDGVLQNGGNTEGTSGEIDMGQVNQKLWMAHGICASLAWAILVPLAIGSSILRRVLEQVGFSKSFWFTMHRGLHLMAALLTMIAFILAVVAINEQSTVDPQHFSTSNTKHPVVGLVIFLLTMLQALGGLVRPHAPSVSPVSKVQEKDEETMAAAVVKAASKVETKSGVRRVWEIGHRVVGTTLLGMAWWQIQSGWNLYAERVTFEDSLTSVFWSVVGSLCGILVGLFVYQQKCWTNHLRL